VLLACVGAHSCASRRRPPNFDRVVQSYQALAQNSQALAEEMGLIPNLPAIHDELAQTRHEELVKLIGNVERRIGGRLDRLETKLAAK
jgi:hypothetical protein